ncbi:hypothetical protein V1511DRAFT_499088 [Dipodascopsis uninucleata]
MVLVGKGIAAAVAVPFYIIFFGISGYSLWRNRFHGFLGPWIAILVFMLFRFIADAILIALYSGSANTSDAVNATVIFGSMSLGPLLAVGHQFMDVQMKAVHDNEPPKLLYWTNLGTHVIHILCVILSMSIGTKLTSIWWHNIITAEQILETISILLLLSFIVLLALTVYYWTLVKMDITSESDRVAHTTEWTLIGTMLFYLLLLIYTIGSAFAVTDDNSWNIFAGSWPLYLCLAVLTQIIICGMFIASMSYFSLRPYDVSKENEMEMGEQQSGEIAGNASEDAAVQKESEAAIAPQPPAASM